ncbi:MAG: hypothetical protein R3F59_25605 [Myxococcota bacterium]
MRIEWGTKGFSVRLDRMSLAYGYPPGTASGAVFQGYLSHVPGPLQADARARWLAAAPLREAGQHTLELVVDADPAAAERALEALWQVADEVRPAEAT